MRNILKNRINVGLKFVYSDDDSLSIIFQSNTVLSGVVGEFNNNVKELEKITKTNIYTRGNSISVKGDQEKITLIKILTITDKTDILNGVFVSFLANKKLENIFIIEKAGKPREK